MSRESQGRGAPALETLAAAGAVALADIIGFVVAGLGCNYNTEGLCGVVKGERSAVLNYVLALAPVVLMLAAGAWSVKHGDRRMLKLGLLILIPASLVLPIILISL